MALGERDTSRRVALQTELLREPCRPGWPTWPRWPGLRSPTSAPPPVTALLCLELQVRAPELLSPDDRPVCHSPGPVTCPPHFSENLDLNNQVMLDL